jgi:hypothetical protein
MKRWESHWPGSIARVEKTDLRQCLGPVRGRTLAGQDALRSRRGHSPLRASDLDGRRIAPASGSARAADHPAAPRRRAHHLPRERPAGRVQAGSRRRHPPGDCQPALAATHHDVEFPNPSLRAGAATSTKRAAMLSARRTVIAACGPPPASFFAHLQGSATITGVGFFDVRHPRPQRGVAPNQIELHPVLAFRATSCRRG